MAVGLDGDAVTAVVDRALRQGRLFGDDRTGRQPVRRAEERRLIGLGGGQLIDDLAAEDDHRPVARKLDLLQLRGVQQDRRATRRKVPQQLVDLALVRISMPRVGSKHSSVFTPAAIPGDRHLLLVATGQPPHLRLGTGVDLQPLDGGADATCLGGHADGPPALHARDGRQGDVLAHGALRQERLGAVRGHVHQAGPDGVGGMAELHGGAIDDERTRGRRARAGEHFEQLVLTLPLERHDAQDLAGAELERDVVELRAGLQPLDPQPRRGRSRRRGGRLAITPTWSSGALPDVASAAALAAAAMVAPPSATSAATGPSISPTIRSSAPLVTSSTPTVSPSRRTVARSHSDAISSIRWEMKITDRPDSRDLAHDVQHPFGEVRWEGGGHLVEQQQVGLRGEGARKVDDPQRRQRQLAYVRPQVELADAQVAQQAPEGRDGGLGEAQVLRDVQVGDQRRLLVDGDDARATRLGGRADEATCRAPGWCRRRGGSAPVRILTRVLLPAPLAPSSAWTSPGATRSEASRSAATAPYRLATPVASSRQVGHGPCDGRGGSGRRRRPAPPWSSRLRITRPGPCRPRAVPCRTWSSPGSCS